MDHKKRIEKLAEIKKQAEKDENFAKIDFSQLDSNTSNEEYADKVFDLILQNLKLDSDDE